MQRDYIVSIKADTKTFEVIKFVICLKFCLSSQFVNLYTNYIKAILQLKTPTLINNIPYQSWLTINLRRS